MVYFDYITCLRYAILVWNPRHVTCVVRVVLRVMSRCTQHSILWSSAQWDSVGDRIIPLAFLFFFLFSLLRKAADRERERDGEERVTERIRSKIND